MIRLIATRKISALGLLLLLAACAVGPNYHAPGVSALGVPPRYSAAAPEGQLPDLKRWWGQFDDPMLGWLVDRALGANLDIAQAVARLRQARAAVTIARADLLPSVEGSAGAGRNFQNHGSDTSSFSVGADANWAIDLFGGTRRSIEASRADLEAAGYDLGSVQAAIAAETARNYVALRDAQARLAVARDVLRTQDDNLHIAGWRVQAGLVSSLDVESAKTQRAQTAATIPTLDTAIAAAENRLAVLIGVAPGTLAAELADIRNIPRAPGDIAVGIPADTLRNRPDVRVAERNLAAATARIGVAKAQLFPALSISGNVGTSALALGSLGDIVTGGLFAGLSQIIFDGGRRAANVHSNEAAAEGALAVYRKTVLTALEDVENGLVALKAARDRQVFLATGLDAANTSALLARSQYRAGLTDFQTLLDAERQLLSARDGLVSAKADEADALIQLYLALGGGWDPAAQVSINDSPPCKGGAGGGCARLRAGMLFPERTVELAMSGASSPRHCLPTPNPSLAGRGVLSGDLKKRLDS